MDAVQERFELVALAGGIHSLRSLTNSQTFHPVVGPAAEAETIHVGGTRLVERAADPRGAGEFVVWDVGLGAAANALAAVAALRAHGGGAALTRDVRLLSFDRSVGALDFAIENAVALSYSAQQRGWMESLRRDGQVSIPARDGGGADGPCVRWSTCLGDFPALVAGPAELPSPHAVFFDPYSPAVNPEMWTLELFTALERRLRPEAPCLLTTYTRSTAVRVTLLLAGFYVGVGRSVGEKDETTMATNVPGLLDRPLASRWVDTKAYVSTNAAPLRAAGKGELQLPVNYTRNPISNEDFARLQAHPQFAA